MMSSVDTTVLPSSRIGGVLRMPGDKSISHRVAMLGALASGVSTVRGYLRSEDCLNTLRAVEAMGARVEIGAETIRLTGSGGRFHNPSGTLDLGNSGTGIRLLAGLVAGQPLDVRMTGDASLCSRPMKRVSDPLKQMGADIELTGPRGCAPMRVRGGVLRGIEYRLPVASAQVKSCVLLAGLFAAGTTTVHEPEPTRDHTEKILRAMGHSIRVDGLCVSLEGSAGAPIRLAARDFEVPGDFSSACFWFAAAAGARGSTVTVRGVGLNPRRTGVLSVLERMGARVSVRLTAEDAWERVGDVTVTGAGLRGTVVGGAEVPNVIDELPLVAVLGALAEGETRIGDAAELRVKETDRIGVMAQSLTGMGVAVEERPDGMIVRGGAPIRGGSTVHSRGDHRIVMAISVLGLFADGETRLHDVACVNTSYPAFWNDLASATGRPYAGPPGATAQV